jgi:hypothetical protein
MSGLEIAAAVATIIGGFAACSKYAGDIFQKLQQRRGPAKAASKAKRLWHSLKGSQTLVRQEWDRVRNLSGTSSASQSKLLVIFTCPSWLIYQSGQTLLKARDTLATLEKLLNELAIQNRIKSTHDFSTYEAMANQSRDLTIQSLQHATTSLAAIASTISLASNSSLSSSSTMTIAPSSLSLQHGSYGRAQFNVHNICNNAILYRQNGDRFAELAYKVPNTDPQEWECENCKMTVSKLEGKFSNNSIWIDAQGFFKAHCQRQSGQVDGWTCIWPIVSTECRSRYDNEKALLIHMKEYHLISGSPGQPTYLHWPADLHNKNPKTCGFGGTIGGQDLNESNTNFVIAVLPV